MSLKSYREPDQSYPCHPPNHSWRSIVIILSSHLLPGLPNGLFPPSIPHQNVVCNSPLPQYIAVLKILYTTNTAHTQSLCLDNLISPALLLALIWCICKHFPLESKYRRSMFPADVTHTISLIKVYFTFHCGHLHGPRLGWQMSQMNKKYYMRCYIQHWPHFIL